MIKLAVTFATLSFGLLGPGSVASSPMAPEVNLALISAFGERCKELDPSAKKIHEEALSYIFKKMGSDRVRQLQASPLYVESLDAASKAIKSMPIKEVEAECRSLRTAQTSIELGKW